MQQSDVSFFYRGVLLLLLGGIAITLLSSINQPWAYYVRTIGTASLFIGSAALISYVAIKGFRQYLDAPICDEPLPSSLLLDQWHRIAQLVVMASVFLAVIFVMVLLFVEPPKKCPNWHLPSNRSSSLWIPFWILTVPILTGVVFMTARWKWLVRKAIESVDYSTMIPVPYTLVITVLIGCGMSQFPWALLVTNCWLER